jgi:hypothetical protein
MVSRIIRALLFLGSAFAIVAFTLVAARLVSGAHPLDPVEVTVLERAEDFARGGPVYTEPARLDDPALMPGLPLVVAPLVQTFGAEVWEPRVVALVAMLLIALLVLAIVRLETDSWTLAFTSVGFLALGFNLLAAPPGIARPELLMLLFVLSAFLALRLTNGIAGPVMAAILAAAAFYTEPQAAWFIAGALFALSIDDRQRLLAFTVTLGVLVGGGYVFLSRTLGPWFNFSAWGEPLQALHWNPAGPLTFVGENLLGKLGVLTIATVLSFALPTAPWRGKGGLWLCMGMAALAAGLVATQTTGFGPAALIPSLLVLALVGPISMQRVTSHLSAWPGSTRMSGQGVVLTALTLQFIMFFACAQTVLGVGP